MLVGWYSGADLSTHFAFSLSDIFRKVEMPSQYCLALLELNGIGFSTAECESQKHIMQAKLDAIETQAYQLAGHSFSFTSADDIAQVYLANRDTGGNLEFKGQVSQLILLKAYGF